MSSRFVPRATPVRAGRRRTACAISRSIGVSSGDAPRARGGGGPGGEHGRTRAVGQGARRSGAGSRHARNRRSASRDRRTSAHDRRAPRADRGGARTRGRAGSRHRAGRSRRSDLDRGRRCGGSRDPRPGAGRHGVSSRVDHQDDRRARRDAARRAGQARSRPAAARAGAGRVREPVGERVADHARARARAHRRVRRHAPQRGVLRRRRDDADRRTRDQPAGARGALAPRYPDGVLQRGLHARRARDRGCHRGAVRRLPDPRDPAPARDARRRIPAHRCDRRPTRDRLRRSRSGRAVPADSASRRRSAARVTGRPRRTRAVLDHPWSRLQRTDRVAAGARSDRAHRHVALCTARCRLRPRQRGRRRAPGALARPRWWAARLLVGAPLLPGAWVRLRRDARCDVLAAGVRRDPAAGVRVPRRTRWWWWRARVGDDADRAPRAAGRAVLQVREPTQRTVRVPRSHVARVARRANASRESTSIR